MGGNGLQGNATACHSFTSGTGAQFTDTDLKILACFRLSRIGPHIGPLGWITCK